jgi:hypothetical protein
MEPDDLLCSRNARPPKALVGRAQWKINQPPSLKRIGARCKGHGEFSRCVRSWVDLFTALTNGTMLVGIVGWS